MMCPAVFQVLIWICLRATGVESQHHEVTHIISKMCVAQKSTALIPCRVSHPEYAPLPFAEWLHQRSPEESARDVLLDPAFEGRVEFGGGDGGNCSLVLRDVRESDAGVFHFALRTNGSAQNSSGISLEVTDAEVEVFPPDVVMEGDLLLLICGSCIPSMLVPTYIWMRDGHVFNQVYGTNQLDLDPVRVEDKGRYSCMLSGHEGLNSSSVAVDVRPGYAPRSVLASLSSSSGVIVEGDSVTLTCSSESNPPVLIYSWFKENQTSSVGSGQSFRPLESGWFYCEAQNKYGAQRSAAVSLTVNEGNHLAVNVVMVGVILAVVVTSVILMVVIVMLIRRRRGTSEGRNHTALQQHHGKIKSYEEDTYMTLDPKSVSSDYDTLDNLRRSQEK